MPDVRYPGGLPAAVRTMQVLDVSCAAIVLVATLVTGSEARSRIEEAARTGASQSITTIVPPYLAVVAGFGAIALAIGAQRLMDARAVRLAAEAGDDISRNTVLLRRYHVRNLTLVVMFEIAAIVNLIAYAVDLKPVSLAMVGLLAACIGLQIPSVQRLTRWLETRQRPVS